MLNTHFDEGWRTDVTPAGISYPGDLAGGRGGQPRRRSTMLADLWRIFEEMKANDPNVTDREVVNAYLAEHPGRPRVTTKTLRALRYRRKVCETKQPAKTPANG